MTQPRYLADENVPLHAVRRLARSGIDIESASSVLPGVADEDVLAYATRNGQVVVSFDKDFGRLVFVERLVPPGVVLLNSRPGARGHPRGAVATADQRDYAHRLLHGRHRPSGSLGTPAQAVTGPFQAHSRLHLPAQLRPANLLVSCNSQIPR